LGLCPSCGGTAEEGALSPSTGLLGGTGRLGGAGLLGFGEFFEVSFTSGSKSHRPPAGATDGPFPTGPEATVICSTLVVALGLAGAGLGGGGRFGRGFRLSSCLELSSGYQE